MSNFVQTAIQCPECGTITYINRKKSLKKKIGHLKKLYCYKCMKEVNQVEVGDTTLYYIYKTTNLIPINKNKDRVVCKEKELND